MFNLITDLILMETNFKFYSDYQHTRWIVGIGVM